MEGPPLDLEMLLEGQVLLLDKPLSWTSFQAVNAVKWAVIRKYRLKKFKIGHAGTLDPLASGLLITCTGKATKRIAEIQGQAKEYTGTITLGATTPSYDLETDIDARFPYDHLGPEGIRAAAAAFIGDIQQVPPVFSALRKDGERLYERARRGESVEVEPRSVTVHGFELERIELPEVDFRIRCGKGTYIRSLAHDLGRALGCGGHLSALRRTAIGDYRVEDAFDPKSIKARLT